MDEKCKYKLNLTTASSSFDSFFTACGRTYIKLQNVIYFPRVDDGICPFCGKVIEIIKEGKNENN